MKRLQGRYSGEKILPGKIAGTDSPESMGVFTVEEWSQGFSGWDPGQ